MKIFGFIFLLLFYYKNVDARDDEPLECLVCPKDDCEAPKPMKCDKPKSIEQCFALYNSKNDIIELGCISAKGDDFISNNFKSLYICNSTDKCNNYDKLPKPISCIECNSMVTEDCSIQPSIVQTDKLCSKLPNTRCYVIVNAEDGTTKRGCASDLPSKVFSNCLNNTSNECLLCDGKNCNHMIFPTDRRRCYRCNSKSDPNCDKAPTTSSICPNYSDDEFCVTKLVNGHTYRGCSTDFICDDHDKQYCQICYDEDNCNVAVLKGNNIGYPGKWQDVPISCYTCQGEESCKNNIHMNLNVCQNNVQQNCYTIFNGIEGVIERGCTDTLYKSSNMELCHKNPDNCKYCKSNGCNKATKLTDYKDCVFCDGTNNRNCVFNPNLIDEKRSCLKGCVTALYPLNEDIDPVYTLLRTCLDDLEESDQNNCTFGNNQHCQSCTDNLCNTVTLGNRLKCYTCEGDNCEKAESLECIAYRENDQCFILFNDNNNTDRMGCVSDMEKSALEANKRHLYLCNGDNCNDLQNISSENACLSCDSLSEPNCSSGLSNKVTNCRTLPYTSCYTLIDNDGITHRGCLSDLDDDDFYGCLENDENGRKCKICNGDKCNDEIYPKDRWSCYRCDSSQYSACENNPETFSAVCPIYKEDDGCFTKLKNDIIYRDCSSQMDCDPNDRDRCRYCDTNANCNYVNLREVYIGPPGQWQPLPLNCLSCKNDECMKSSNLTSVECQGNSLQNCVTVFDENEMVIMRDCSDTVASIHGEYCDINPKLCIGCKSNDCNNAYNIGDFIDCYNCDSQKDALCRLNFIGQITKTRRCHESCMVALYPINATSNDTSYDLMRSCLDDMDIEDRNKCGTDENPLCLKCNGKKCNIMNLPKNRHKCYYCANNNNCESIVSKICELYHPNEQCYILFDGENNIERLGCRSDLTSDNITSLIHEKKLYLCNDGVNCNHLDRVPSPQKCTVCDSRMDPFCATNPNLIVETDLCNILPYTGCYTRIDEDGHTVRGCLSSLESDVFYDCLMDDDDDNKYTHCVACYGENCNNLDIYPSDRLKCHQCKSTDDPLCAFNPSKVKPCPIYDDDDKCITNLRDNVTIRTCYSSMPCDDERNPLTCEMCTSDGCNDANLMLYEGAPGKWQHLPLTCYTCLNKEDCNNKGKLWPCSTNATESCMTVFDEEGSVIGRGCSNPIQSKYGKYCKTNPNNCMRCNSNGCNLANSLDDYVECLSCDSLFQGNCITNDPEIFTIRQCHKYCMTVLYPLHKDIDDKDPSYGLSRTCYDDMDLDDRLNCLNGTMDSCTICNKTKCNTDSLLDSQLRCYMCNGDDCQNPKSDICHTYRSNDKCYIRYDENYSIISMGCRSEFSSAEADDLLKLKRLYLCNSDDCNSLDNIPDIQKCVLCNSRTDKDCSVNPTAVTSSTTCRIKPYTDCYSRVLPDGATERGCLSNLYNDEFLTCLNGTSTTCQVCRGDNCNNEIYPVNRLRCHVCDSDKNNKCETVPNNVNICPLYDANDKCITTLIDGVTYRNCKSSLSCENDKDLLNCQTCSSDGCNIVNLLKLSDIDTYGKWQKLPLKCLDCSGEECETLNMAKEEECSHNILQDCMTVFNNNGKVERRGCSDQVEYELDQYNTRLGRSVYRCKSNKCNTAVSISDFMKCFYCDTKNDFECLWNPNGLADATRLCEKGCMTAMYRNDDGYEDLIRTCLTDKEPNDQAACSKDKSKNCLSCTGDYCNTHVMPPERFSCYTCSGDDDCLNPETKLCPVHKPDDQCFIRFKDVNNNTFINDMGCLSSLRVQNVAELIKTKLFFLCSGMNCNTMALIPPEQECLKCNSNVDGDDCAIEPNKIRNITQCTKMPYPHCYVKLNSDGSTERGCLSDLAPYDFADCILNNDTECSTCFDEDGEEICNNRMYPEERLECYTCSSDEDPSCESYPVHAKPCPLVHEMDGCRTAVHGNVTVRGCKSRVYCDENDGRTCRSCFESKCNSIDLINKEDDGSHGVWQDLPLKCYTCNADDCQAALGTLRECSGNNIEQDCKTVFTVDGKVKRRGCSDDVDDYEDLYCRLHPAYCVTCKSNECNVAWHLSDYIDCVFCDSRNDAQCIQNPDNTSLSKRQCYNNCMVTLIGDRLIRSCLDDKEWQDQAQCSINTTSTTAVSTECLSCSESNCNKFPIPSDRRKCYACSDSCCSDTVLHYCENYHPNDSCFAKYTQHGTVELLGCLSSLSLNDINSWAAEKTLYVCDDPECNELSQLPKPTTCLKCDSEKFPYCVAEPEETSIEICPPADGRCVTRIKANGHTSRGCFANLNAIDMHCEEEGACQVCSGDNCNNQVYPAHRLECYECHTAFNDDCIDKLGILIKPRACTVYNVSGTCVTKYENGLLVRGCDTNVKCHPDNIKHCNICKENGCNTINLKPPSSLAPSSLSMPSASQTLLTLVTIMMSHYLYNL